MKETVKDKFLNKFKDLGYKYQASIVRAVMKDNDYYSDKQEKSLRAYLNQVLLGHRPLSTQMEECLISVSKQDDDIIKLCKMLRNTINSETYDVNEVVKDLTHQMIAGSINELKIMIDNKTTVSEKFSIVEKFQSFVDNLQ